MSSTVVKMSFSGHYRVYMRKQVQIELTFTLLNIMLCEK